MAVEVYLGKDNCLPRATGLYRHAKGRKQVIRFLLSMKFTTFVSFNCTLSEEKGNDQELIH